MSGGHLGLQITVGGGQNTNVHLNRLGRAHPEDGLVLDHIQQLGLYRQGQLADLIQKDRAAVGLLKEACPPPWVSAGKSAAYIAEHFTLEQRGGDGGAIHLKERAFPGLGLLDGAGQMGFARCRFRR